MLRSICKQSRESVESVLKKKREGCGALRQIRSVRNSIPREAMLSLVVSLVLTRLDYGSATLAGLPAHLVD